MTTSGDGGKGLLLVTGASRGIGAAIARQGAAAGYTVCVNYRADEDGAQAVAAAIEEAGGDAFLAQGDVATDSGIASMFAAVDARREPLRGLVNNAGFTGKISSLAEADRQTIRDIVDLNVTGLMLCAREAVPRMSTKQGGQGGAIVNISSGAATLGSPGQYVWYAASKGAVDSFTIGLGKEVAGEGIRVNAVAPGMVETGIHAAAGMPDRMAEIVPSIPIGRGAQADEIARAVMYLLSEEDASYVAGAILRVAGGR